MTIFVDTSAFYAAADAGDRQHARARELLSRGEPLVTSDHVLAETWLLLNARLGRAAAERFWEALRAGAARIEAVGAVDLEVAWEIGRRFADQPFSLVDRTSFAVMHRLGLRRAASFDDDFLVYRFGRDDREALTVLR